MSTRMNKLNYGFDQATTNNLPDGDRFHCKFFKGLWRNYGDNTIFY